MKRHWLIPVGIVLILVSSCATPQAPLAPPAEPSVPPTTPEQTFTLTEGKAVSGIIAEDTTWSGNIYATGVEVAEGATLTIEPGTVVRFKHWRHGYTDPEERVGAIIVRGTLRAVGTAEKPIRFTSDAIDPQHGDWQGIVFQAPASSQNILDYCIIEYANVGVMATDVNFTLSNSIVRWSLGGNVCPMRSSPIITHNRLYECGHGVIEMEGYCYPTITFNTIWGGRNGIFVGANSHAIISHNIIRDLRSLPDSGGLVVVANSSAAIEYNTIMGAKTGISIFPDCSASKTTVRYNNIYDNVGNIAQHSAEDLIAKENWWGTTDKEQIRAKFGMIDGRVIYEPYLTSLVDIGKLTYDYENNETYEKLPQSDKDTYLYMYPDDLTRKVIDLWYHGRGFPSSVAWDGQHLWVSTFSGPIPYEIRKFDLSGKFIDSFPYPGPWPYGLAFDGKYLWCLDYAEAKVYQLDTSGKVIKSIPAPGKGPAGLTYDGEYLWTIPWTGGEWEAYRFDTSGNIIGSLQVPGVTGLAWYGGHLWVSSGTKFYEMDPLDGNVIRVITSSGDKSFDITWQGSYIWSAEWGNEIETDTRVVKMLPLEERITIDGLRNEWLDFSPLMLDPKGDNANENEETDIKAVYGFTDDKYFYLMIELYARTIGQFDHVDVEVDLNGDGKREYLLGSARCRGTPLARGWGLGVGITDFRGEEIKQSYRRYAPGYLYAHSNMKEVFEFKVPLSFIENRADFTIKCYLMDKSDGKSLVIDETDWAYVSRK